MLLMIVRNKKRINPLQKELNTDKSEKKTSRMVYIGTKK